MQRDAGEKNYGKCTGLMIRSWKHCSPIGEESSKPRKFLEPQLNDVRVNVMESRGRRERNQSAESTNDRERKERGGRAGRFYFVAEAAAAGRSGGARAGGPTGQDRGRP